MGWIEAHAVTIGVATALVVHWVRMEIALAVMQRDLAWMRAAFNKWGFPGPTNES